MKRAIWTALMVSLLLIGTLVVSQGKEAESEDGVKPAVEKANSQFALDLYKELVKEKGNLVFSPFSISTAFGMTSAGANGKTKKEFEDVFHFPEDQETLHKEMGLVISDLNGREKRSYTLSTANSLWGRNDLSKAFKKDFVNLLGKNYDAGMQWLDFSKEPIARKAINDWVEEKTQQRIKDLIPQNIIDEDTALVLVNAIYFKGLWKRPFEEHLTKEMPFYVDADKEVQATMMQLKKEEFSYLEVDSREEGSFQILSMPYHGDEISMLIFLPKAKDGLGNMEKAMTLDNLTTWLGKLKTEEVNISFPKFKVNTEISLKEIMIKLGMKTAFSNTEADFSKMISEKHPLYISDSFHKAFVDVNEQGTEAAGASSVVMRDLAYRTRNKTCEFKADHPFMFMIRDNKTGSILFMGRVKDPGKES